MEYSRELEDRIAKIRSQSNFVPLDKVEAHKYYWWHIVTPDDKIKMFPGIAFYINGNLAVCSQLSRMPTFISDDSRIFGAYRQGEYNSKIAIARMYEEDLGNHDMAYTLWKEAVDSLTPEQWKTRQEHRARMFAGMRVPPEWVPQAVKVKIAEARDAMAEIEEAQEAEDAEEVFRAAGTPEFSSILDRALAKIGLQRIPKED